MIETEDETVKDAHTLLHPIRFRIVELLTEKPLHISALSKEMGEERRLVVYHLLTLEEAGFVASKYEISEAPKSRGRAVRIYSVTDKVRAVIDKVKAEL